MNYEMARLADKIANKLRVEDDKRMPQMMYHHAAYEVILLGKEEVEKYLSHQEIDETEYYESVEKMKE